MTIKCLKYRTCLKGVLQGFADLWMPLNKEATMGVVFKDCTLNMKNGQRWINFPSRAYDKDDGTKGYSPYIYFLADGEKGNARSMKENFDKKAITAIEKYCAENAEMRQLAQPNETQDNLPF